MMFSDIIRLLLAINRPVIDPITVIKGVINRLMIVERGISKYNITKMKEIINNLS